MDNEEFESLASSSYFDKVNSNDMEETPFSPPPAEITPIIYVRKPSLSAQGSSETLSDPNMYYGKKDRFINKYGITSIGRRFTQLLPFSYRSYDNLTQFQTKETEQLSEADFIHFNTQSLPPSPMGTPSGTPQGSPKLPRNQVPKDCERTKDENLNSLPWYYTGIFAATPENKEIESYSKERSRENRFMSSETKASNNNVLPVRLTPCYFHRDSPNPQKKFSFSNRDMNFLAPTSM